MDFMKMHTYKFTINNNREFTCRISEYHFWGGDPFCYVILRHGYKISRTILTDKGREFFTFNGALIYLDELKEVQNI